MRDTLTATEIETEAETETDRDSDRDRDKDYNLDVEGIKINGSPWNDNSGNNMAAVCQKDQKSYTKKFGPASTPLMM